MGRKQKLTAEGINNKLDKLYAEKAQLQEERGYDVHIESKNYGPAESIAREKC